MTSWRAAIGQHHRIGAHLAAGAGEMPWRGSSRRKANGTLFQLVAVSRPSRQWQGSCGMIGDRHGRHAGKGTTRAACRGKMPANAPFFARACRPEEIMAGGFAKDGAVQDQIDASIEDAVSRARHHLSQGEGLGHCEECGEAIPEARREAVPGVRLCVPCQAARDRAAVPFAGYNRRGSKDSQLR
jgi:phage/conjugal plasmid C-4 type zinc finger TraR family protein